MAVVHGVENWGGGVARYYARWALSRIRIDADACVKCGACAKQCAKGALVVCADKSIAIDASSCVVCGNCLATCPKGAISL